MQKGQLKNGRKILIVRVEHFVKDEDFAKALTEKYYEENESFNEKLTKKEAEIILKRSLFFEGLNGSYGDGFFEASYEDGKRYNEIYQMAISWVRSKYQWISNNQIK